MNFELKVQAPKNQPVVWNFDELKSNLETALADYQNRVYTEDTIDEAKTDRAKLNKLKKAINDERISREKEYMQPFNEFKAQAKELCDMIDTASSGIGEQLDAFEQKRIDEKDTKIESIFAEISSLYPIDFITLEKIFNEKWYNKGTSDKAIAKEITDIFEKAVNDLAIIKRMPRYAFEAEEAYKDLLDLNKALAEGERMAEIQARKGQETQASAESEIAVEMSFKCKITKTQAEALIEFCKKNGITLQRI